MVWLETSGIGLDCLLLNSAIIVFNGPINSLIILSRLSIFLIKACFSSVRFLMSCAILQYKEYNSDTSLTSLRLDSLFFSKGEMIAATFGSVTLFSKIKLLNNLCNLTNFSSNATICFILSLASK